MNSVINLNYKFNKAIESQKVKSKITGKEGKPFTGLSPLASFRLRGSLSEFTDYEFGFS